MALHAPEVRAAFFPHVVVTGTPCRLTLLIGCARAEIHFRVFASEIDAFP
jgi:hypothetical protein